MFFRVVTTENHQKTLVASSASSHLCSFTTDDVNRVGRVGLTCFRCTAAFRDDSLPGERGGRNAKEVGGGAVTVQDVVSKKKTITEQHPTANSLAALARQLCYFGLRSQKKTADVEKQMIFEVEKIEGVFK